MTLELPEQPLLENFGMSNWADPAGSTPPVDRFARMTGRREDTPFRPWLRLRDASEIAAALALDPHPQSCVNEAVFAVLAALIVLEQTGGATWLFYSRDNNHYSDARRYVPTYYRRKPLTILHPSGLSSTSRLGRLPPQPIGPVCGQPKVSAPGSAG